MSLVLQIETYNGERQTVKIPDFCTLTWIVDGTTNKEAIAEAAKKITAAIGGVYRVGTYKLNTTAPKKRDYGDGIDK